MIIEIEGKYLVSSEILTEYFCCDYPVCKGCCCIVGDSGAPLSNSECAALRNQFELYKPYLSEQGLQAINKQGFSVIDLDGDVVTPLVTSKGECAYSFTTSDGFTYCAVEKGFESSLHRDAAELSAAEHSHCTAIRKPISCWLYPIRVGVLSNGYISLILSREHLCKEAFEKGHKEGVRVYEFLRAPLIHRFGEEFYNELQAAAKEL